MCLHERTELVDWYVAEDFVTFTTRCVDCRKTFLDTLTNDYADIFRKLFPNKEMEDAAKNAGRNQSEND